MSQKNRLTNRTAPVKAAKDAPIKVKPAPPVVPVAKKEVEDEK